EPPKVYIVEVSFHQTETLRGSHPGVARSVDVEFVVSSGVQRASTEQGSAMRLKDFNTAPDQEALDLVLACADVQRWAQEIVAHRPYESVEGAVEAAMTLADPWTSEEVDAALARHP